MKRIGAYLGMVFAACMACFAIPAMADAIGSSYSVARQMVVMQDPQGVAMQRLELTLAQWRAQSQSSDASLSSGMRAESNHFVMAVTVPVGVPDWPVSTQA